jgi:CRP/FNR family transcriptional regulator, cyclic AMP receptor protein
MESNRMGITQMNPNSKPTQPRDISYAQDAVWNLWNLRLFETLTARELRKLKPLLDVRHCHPGEFLFHMGDSADRLYFVERGTVKVSVFSPDGEEHMLDIFKQGDTFGELFVDDDRRRRATAQALSSVTVWTLTAAAFERLVQTLPKVCHNFGRYLLQDQRRVFTRMEALVHMKAGPRLLTYMLELAERCGQRIGVHHTLMPGKFTQVDLARMVGLNRTTVSLLINEYRRQGILGGEKSTLLVHPVRARAFLRKAGLVLA